MTGRRRRWVRIEPGEYEYRDGDVVLASVQQESRWRWHWMVAVGHLADGMGLCGTAGSAKVIAEEAVNRAEVYEEMRRR